MSYRETQAGIADLRWLLTSAKGGHLAVGDRRRVRGELQGRCNGGRFVLALPGVGLDDPYIGLLECETDTPLSDIERRDHLTVEIEVIESATTMEVDVLKRLVDQRRFVHFLPDLAWIRARVISIDDVDRTYRIATPAICNALAPLGIPWRGPYWDWGRDQLTGPRWGTYVVGTVVPEQRARATTSLLDIERPGGDADAVSLFAYFEGTRVTAQLAILELHGDDPRRGIPAALEAIALIGQAAGLPPIHDACVQAIHDGTSAVSEHHAVRDGKIRIKLVADCDGRSNDELRKDVPGPWSQTAPMRIASADAAAFTTYSPKLELRDGMLIRHPKFGDGIVVATQLTTADVQFGTDAPRKLAHRK